MIWQVFQQKVRRAFSESAVRYDVLSGLHREIGRELLQAVIDRPCRTILDVGCGTGYLSGKAKNYFPEACVVGIDLAEGMIAEAKAKREDVRFVQADALQLPFRSGSFDGIVSNLSYQWVRDLPAAFRSCRRVLTEEGYFCFTMFGHATCRELFDSLEACRPQGQSRAIERLPGQEFVTTSLQESGFAKPVVRSESIRIEFADLWDLLKWLKNIGANVLNADRFIGKDWLERANRHCLQNFSYHEGIGVTFEVIWVFAGKSETVVAAGSNRAQR